MGAIHLLDALRRVQDLTFTARSTGSTGWDGSGIGIVLVELPDPDVIIFHESGIWRPRLGGELRFRNAYRWSRSGPDSVRLEHLRFGQDRPVELFELVPESVRSWSSIRPHQCAEDCYSAELRIDDDCLACRWTIVGPRKREDLEYLYRWPADS